MDSNKKKDAINEPLKEVNAMTKCACPGCGIEFWADEGVSGTEGELYCTKEHAEIAKIIKEAK